MPLPNTPPTPEEIDRASTAATLEMMQNAKAYRGLRPMPLEVQHYSPQPVPSDTDWASTVEPLDRSWILFVKRDGTPFLSYRDEETGLQISEAEYFAREKARRAATPAEPAATV